MRTSSFRPRLPAALLCFWLVFAAAAADAAAEPSLRVVVTAAEAPTTAATLSAVAVDGGPGYEWPIAADGGAPAVGTLPPGDYDVVVSVGDGRSARLRVRVDTGRTSVLVVTLPAGSDTTALPTLAAGPSYQSTEGALFDRRALRDLPTADDAWTLVEIAAPFVIADRMSTGGLGLGRSALVSTRGESWAATGVAFDGIPVRSPTPSGRLPLVVDMHAVEAVGVASGLAAAEVETPGVLIELVPKRAGRRWAGAFDASVTTPGMVGNNAEGGVPAVERIEDWRGASLSGGGPIGGRDAGLFLSAGFARATFLERDQPPVLSSHTRTVAGRYDGSPAPRQHLRVLGGFEVADYPFDDRRQLADRNVSEQGRFGRVLVGWSGTSPAGSLRSFTLSLQRGAWRPELSSGVAGGVVDRVFDGMVPRPPADLVHLQVDARGDWRGRPVHAGGLVHEVRAGLSFRRTTATRETLALPTVAETVQRQVARIWVPEPIEVASSRQLHETGLYVADRISAGASFTVDLGVRADLTRGSTAGSETRIRWNTVSPRLALRWHYRALSLFGGVGSYASGRPLEYLAFGDPGEVTWNVYGWTERIPNFRYDPGETGPLVARAGYGPTVASIDPDLRASRSTEWTTGAEVRLTPYSTLRGAIVIRRQADLPGVLNVGLTDADWRMFTIDDIGADEGSAHDDQLLPIYERLPSGYGRDQLLLTNPDAAGPVRHDGIELTYEIRSPRWLMLFGATAYRTVGLGGAQGFRALENDPFVLGDRYWNPNALKDPEGRLFFDRAYVGKWTTAYRAPGDVRLAAVVRYQDGQPFTRFAAVPGMRPEIIHAYAMGRTRFTYTATVDARIEKGVTWGHGRRASVRLDIFNLTNHANEVEEDVWTGPGFRRSTILQPPRTLRLGVRVEF